MDFVGTMDPARVLYDALVPFLVASLENSFGECFKIMRRYDKRARAKIPQQTRKVDITDLLAVNKGERRVEDVIAEWHSFQNIDSIQRAFSDWFGIHFWKIMRTEAKVAAKLLTRRSNT